MTMGAVDLQVRTGPLVDRDAFVVRVAPRGSRPGQRLGEVAEVIKRHQLVGHDAVVVVIASQLRHAEPVDRAGSRGVAKDALRAARVMPRLLTKAAGRRGVLDLEGAVTAVD